MRGLSLPFWILMFSFFCVCAGKGQNNYTLHTFTTKDGLPHDQIRSIAQDSTGFIWIATFDGLSRYDGYEFKNYYHNPDDSLSLPFITIQKVVVDRYNNIWILTGNRSVSLYNKSKDSFEEIRKSSGNNDQLVINVDNNGELWQFSYAFGLEKYDYQSKKLNKTNAIDNSNHIVNWQKYYGSPFFISFDNNGNICIILTNEKLLRIFKGNFIDKMTVKVELSEFKNNVKLIPSFKKPEIEFKPYFVPPVGNYLYTNAGAFQIDNSQSCLIESNDLIFSSYRISNPIAWISGKNRIYVLFPGEDKTPSHYDIQDNFTIQTVTVDKNRNIWSSGITGANEGTGLTRIIPVPDFFRHYLMREDTAASLDAYFAVLKDHFGNIWAAARNHDFVYRIRKGEKAERLNKLGKYLKEISYHPRSLLEDSTGIWIGYYWNMLMYFDYKTGKFIRQMLFTEEDEGQKEWGVRNLLKNKNQLVFSSQFSVNTYNISDNETKRVTQINDQKHTIFSLTRDYDGNYLVGSGGGIIRQLDKEFNEKKRWIISKGKYNVEDICLSDSNIIWIALLGGGLVSLNLENDQTETYTTAKGLCNNACYCILKDRKGLLWISTDNGISRFNPQTKHFRNFGLSDGLKIKEFNSDAAYLAPDGEMFFGGMGGIVSFYPDSLIENLNLQKAIPLVITDFKVSGTKRYFKKAIYESDTISLNKGDNNFQATFACLDFQNPEKVRYRYRLSGVNDNWTETGHRQRFVNYTNLDPGSYLLEIEATNPNGDWVSRTTLNITIPPWYYQTWWFRIVTGLTFLSLVSYFIFSYLRHERLKARQKQDELRLESLCGQMNPHFIFNSLNSINYFISQNDRLSANRYIADFARLIRAILGNMSNDYIPFSRELESLEDYLKLEHLRFGDKFDYTIKVPDGMETTELMVFPGLVQPFVENAIWHGVRSLENRKGHINIIFTIMAADKLRCMVEDDGVGRRLAEQRKSTLPGKTSRGIGIVLERLRIINNLRKTSYQVKIEDLYPGAEETGTRVSIEIPVREA